MPQNWISWILHNSLGPILSFILGVAVGATSSYMTVRADATALTARVTVEEGRITMLEQNIAEWRTADEHTSAALSQQVSDAVAILTQLRIRLGPGK
jgi:hypothetical protein